MSTVDEAKLNELLGKVMTDLGAVAAVPLALLGERLGLFRTLVDGEAVTPEQLAERTRTTERNVREWLAAMAASGYLTYEGGDRFRMAVPSGTVHLAGSRASRRLGDVLVQDRQRHVAEQGREN
ncbi:hypothetical protein [Streptomyces sp. NPDC093097]|uniref:hypothetical protein n=1 Tax=Streptomyces sp. NPDC093097 TaxID=3366027 RepID=UPI003815FE7C